MALNHNSTLVHHINPSSPRNLFHLHKMGTSIPTDQMVQPIIINDTQVMQPTKISKTLIEDISYSQSYWKKKGLPINETSINKRFPENNLHQQDSSPQSCDMQPAKISKKLTEEISYLQSYD